jgi:hypothetical protein
MRSVGKINPLLNRLCLSYSRNNPILISNPWLVSVSNFHNFQRISAECDTEFNYAIRQALGFQIINLYIFNYTFEICLVNQLL